MMESHHRDLREAAHTLAVSTIDTCRVRVEIVSAVNEHSIASFRLNEVCYVLVTGDGSRKDLPALTRREREIALQIARGYGTKQIAHYLGISLPTTITYVNRFAQSLVCANMPPRVSAPGEGRPNRG